jgi:hypothetical protein
MLNASSIPRGFQLSITGRNALEQAIVNNWVVLYDNDCGIFPVVTEGMVAGWTVFVSENPVSHLDASLSHHRILTLCVCVCCWYSRTSVIRLQRFVLLQLRRQRCFLRSPHRSANSLLAQVLAWDLL